MKRYSVTEARKRIADVLDGAEHGEAVLIERKGVRFKVVLDTSSPVKRSAPALEILDRAVERGDWTWKSGRQGLSFVRRRGR